MEHFGTYLKSQREKKGIRIEEIASITKIHLHMLGLMEKGLWEQLPPEPFIRGFIIAYTKYVGIDTKESLMRYAEEVASKKGGPSDEPSTNFSPSTASPPSHPSPTEVIRAANSVSGWKILGGTSVVLGATFVLVFIYIGKKADHFGFVFEKSNQETASTPDNPTPHSQIVIPPNQSSPLASELSLHLPALPPPTTLTGGTEHIVSQREPPLEKKGHEVTIEGKERTWIKVVTDDKAPIEYFLPKGEKISYSAQNKIKVVLGNATGTKVIHNGEVSTGVKYSGTIRSYLFPLNAKFPQDVPSERSLSSQVLDDKKPE